MVDCAGSAEFLLQCPGNPVDIEPCGGVRNDSSRDSPVECEWAPVPRSDSQEFRELCIVSGGFMCIQRQMHCVERDIVFQKSPYAVRVNPPEGSHPVAPEESVVAEEVVGVDACGFIENHLSCIDAEGGLPHLAVAFHLESVA